MPDLTPSGRITAGGMTVLADEAAREVQVEASIADMILADVLAMNWRLVITCLNPECGHGAEPSMSQIAVGFRRGLGNTVAELASRMHCKACGGRRLKVMNRQGGEFSYYAAGGAEAREAAFREWLAGVYASEDGGGT
jgi:hypothetical protein